MKQIGILSALAGLSALFAGGAPALAHPLAPSARFVEGPCRLPVADVAMRCGEVLVPERRDGGSSRTIALGVQVVMANREPRQADPIILLGGGPGEILTDKAPAIAMSAGVRDRDVILLDQRGVGLSRPALVCTDVAPDERIEGFLAPAERARRLKACAERYSRDTDLSAYSTVENAADVVDVIRALGYRQWNILGVSYGTRLGLTVMRMKPQGLRSVALDSPYPPEVNGFDAKPALFFDQLDKVLADCAADADCARAYPNLKTRAVDALLTLTRRSAPAQLRPQNGGSPKPAQVSARLALGDLRKAMYNHDALHRVPMALDRLAKADYAGYFAALDGPRNSDIPSPPRPPGDFSLGMQLSVQCSDEQGWGGRRRPVSGSWPPEVVAAFKYPYDRPDCQAWKVRSAPAALHGRVSSDLPVLILVGGYDPVTPPVLAKAMLPALPQARLVVMPGRGHSITTTQCGQMLLSQFIADPARPPDESCVTATGRDFHFQISP